MQSRISLKYSMSKILGYIAHEGPSVIDGAPVVVIVNKIYGASKNEKTGAIVQSFIIRADVDPVKALQTGADVSVCGQCEHRPVLAKETGKPPCYVQVAKSVLAVYNAYKRGRYVRADAATIAKALEGKIVRIGTYGDPAAAPVTMWTQITRYAAGRRGYTHQWDTIGFDVNAWAPLVMASADTIDQAAKANLLGMRVFRVSNGIDVQAGEAMCPASAEAGRKSTCAKCTLCAGTSIKARDIVIADHAAGYARRTIAIATA
jgi:hypothetical protein